MNYPVICIPPRRWCFFNTYRRPPRDDGKSTFFHVINGLKLLGGELKKFKEEVMEGFRLDRPMYYPDEIIPFYKFNNQEILDKFQVVTDSDNNQGQSHGTFNQTQLGTALFSGRLDIRVPKDGKLRRTGYVVLQSYPETQSFQRSVYLDWTYWTHLVIRCRGDGRAYMLVLSVFGDFDVTWNLVYQYPLYTRGGPYWQLAKIPFSKFFVANKGRIQDKQCAIPQMKITKIGIACADRNPGPFSLEVDFIGGLRDSGHLEKFAYEEYEVPSCYVAGNPSTASN